MYKATVIEAFIATPSDVVHERNVIREIVNEWNIVNSKSRLAVLKCLGWENDVYATLSEGRAQESINKQILEESDLIIGVFWTRIGTPTGDYISGSVEEITKHINKGKPVMLFFSDMPVRPDSVDSIQYEKLRDFKKWCYDKGLVNPYEKTEDFINIFRRQLGLLMNNEPKILDVIGAKKGGENNNIQSNAQRKNALSENAIQLLTEIAQDQSGELLSLMTLGGYDVHTNGKNFGTDGNDPRAQAEINAAIEELESYDLIRPNNYKREIFTITSNGYKVVDKINA